MTVLQLVVLALVQGITEFLPISSKAHLVLVREFLLWDQDLLLDVAVHVGTLAAVVIYFWRDIGSIVMPLVSSRRRRGRDRSRLALYLCLATLPVIAAGALVYLFAPGLLEDPVLIMATTIGFAILLYGADRLGLTVRNLDHMTLSSALFIGCAQALAILPGTSRAGITMTAARMAGFERDTAARFAMLLSIPVIVAAGAVAGYELVKSGNPVLTLDAGIAAVLAFAVALLAIWVLMQLVRRVGFTPFVIYRLLLGAGLIVWLYA